MINNHQQLLDKGGGEIHARFSAAVLTFTVVIPVYAETINFDDFETSGWVDFAESDRYRSVGIVFDAPIPIADVRAVEGDGPANFLFSPEIGGSAPNVLALNNVPVSQGGAGGVMEIEAYFVLPDTNTPAKTDQVEILVYDGNPGTNLGTIEAFDIDGNLVDEATAVTEQGHYGSVRVLSVSHPNISRIRLSVDADGADFDNLTFNDLTPIGVSGSVTGFQVLEVSCQNQTTGQKIKLDPQEPVTLWDCAAAGLETESGDKIKIDLRGEAN